MLMQITRKEVRMFCPECGQITGHGPMDGRHSTVSAKRGLMAGLLVRWRARRSPNGEGSNHNLSQSDRRPLKRLG